jgi:hypothetical protein
MIITQLLKLFSDFPSGQSFTYFRHIHITFCCVDSSGLVLEQLLFFFFFYFSLIMWCIQNLELYYFPGPCCLLRDSVFHGLLFEVEGRSIPKDRILLKHSKYQCRFREVKRSCTVHLFKCKKHANSPHAMSEINNFHRGQHQELAMILLFVTWSECEESVHCTFGNLKKEQ